MVEIIKGFVDIKSLSPRGFLPLPRGYTTCIKSLQICIKSDFEEINLKLATYGKEKRPFCCHQNFVPNGFSAPARGYIHNGET